jgi:putative ABC transport system ATP-binding protein
MSVTASQAAPETVVEAAARAIDVVKIYGSGETEVRALDGVDVVLPKRRFTAIMGPSGSGKSTLLHCLAGLDEVTSGTIFLGDAEVTALDEKERTLLRRDRVGFIFQFFNLVPNLDALENITLPLALARREPDRAWVNEVVDILGLRDRLGHRPSELSGGQQQRVAAARALVSRPEVVFADEPTGNLDSRRGAELLGFMRRAVDDLAQTIVMVTHDPVAASYSDLVVFLADGKVADIIEQPTVESVFDRMKTLEG